MILPHLFSAPPEDARHLFFAIHVSDQAAESVLWQVVNGQLSILTRSARHTWKDDESCISAVDRSLQELGKESEDVKETLFALPPGWVNEHGIVTAKKPLFQKMTKELSLSPIGFVVTTEAVTQLISQQSLQSHFFFIEVEPQQLTVSLLKNSQVVTATKVGRSGESVSDVVEAMAHFTEKVFPAKMVLFSETVAQKDLTEMQQELLGNDWVSAYPFLHQPIIDVYDSASLLSDVIATGARAVAEAKGLIKENIPAGGSTPTTQVSAMPMASAESTEPVTSSAESEKSAQTEFPAESAAASTEHEEEHFDFNDVSPSVVPAALVSEVPAAPASELPTHSTLPPTEPKLPSPPEVFDFSRARKSKKSFFKSHVPFVAIGVVTGVLALGLIGFVAARTMVKAIVTLELNTQQVTKEATFTLSPTAASNPDTLTLHADLVTKEVEGDQTANTSGTKIIGERAKGTITLFNYTTNAKTFAAGTKLANGSNSYTLDQAVTVASASSTLNSQNQTVTTPASIDTTITAVVIGETSNIASGLNLTGDGFSISTYLAKTKTALTGGSSREARVVSQQDKDQLVTVLRATLTDKALQQFKSGATDGQFFIPTGRVKPIVTTYNTDVGKQSDTLSLHLRVQVEALAYKSADLTPLTRRVLQTDVPSGYELGPADPQMLSNPNVSSASAQGQVTLQTNISATALPSINIDDLKTGIAGKSVKEAQAFLDANQMIRTAKIGLRPQLLSLFGKQMPKKKENIQVQVTNASQ